MLADDPSSLCSACLGRQNIFLLAQGQNLAADQTGHGYPVQKGENNKQRYDIGADFLQDRTLKGFAQRLAQDRRQKDDHQHIRQRIDDIDDPHDDDIHHSSGIARDRPDDQADDKHDNTGKKADREGNTCAVDDADKIIASRGVCSEYVGKDLLPLLNLLEFRLRIFEGLEIVVG